MTSSTVKLPLGKLPDLSMPVSSWGDDRSNTHFPLPTCLAETRARKRQQKLFLTTDVVWERVPRSLGMHAYAPDQWESIVFISFIGSCQVLLGGNWLNLVLWVVQYLHMIFESRLCSQRPLLQLKMLSISFK